MSDHKDYLENQKECLNRVYKKMIEVNSVVETDRCSLAASAKAAARIIHFGEYDPFNFYERLDQIKKAK
jgi:hypothetical protein